MAVGFLDLAVLEVEWGLVVRFRDFFCKGAYRHLGRDPQLNTQNQLRTLTSETQHPKCQKPQTGSHQQKALKFSKLPFLPKAYAALTLMVPFSHPDP